MQTKVFFRIAVLLPLGLLFLLWCWEPVIWHGYYGVEASFATRASDFVTSYLRLGGAHYMLSAFFMLQVMNRLRSRMQVQLLFALSPVIFFAICCGVSVLQHWLLPLFGVKAPDSESASVLLAIATLMLGSVYAFVVSVLFIGLRAWFGPQSRFLNEQPCLID
jgi:hypothetical protein